MLIQHSKENPNWGTPPHVVDWARAIMGGIDLDVCSTPKQNLVVGASQIYTERGEYQQWSGRVFCNPPGGPKNVKTFWNCAVRHPGEVFWVGFALSQLAYLPGIMSIGHGCILRKRTAFLDENGTPQKRPAHYNYIWYSGGGSWDPRGTRFREVMGPHANAFW